MVGIIRQKCNHHANHSLLYSLSVPHEFPIHFRQVLSTSICPQIQIANFETVPTQLNIGRSRVDAGCSEVRQATSRDVIIGIGSCQSETTVVGRLFSLPE